MDKTLPELTSNDRKIILHKIDELFINTINRSTLIHPTPSPQNLSTPQPVPKVVRLRRTVNSKHSPQPSFSILADFRFRSNSKYGICTSTNWNYQTVAFTSNYHNNRWNNRSSFEKNKNDQRGIFKNILKFWYIKY